MPRKSQYNYVTIEKKPQRFICFSDIAEEFCIGKGVVAGRFYRSKDNTIVINNVKIKRTLIDNKLDI